MEKVSPKKDVWAIITPQAVDAGQELPAGSVQVLREVGHRVKASNVSVVGSVFDTALGWVRDAAPAVPLVAFSPSVHAQEQYEAYRAPAPWSNLVVHTGSSDGMHNAYMMRSATTCIFPLFVDVLWPLVQMADGLDLPIVIVTDMVEEVRIEVRNRCRSPEKVVVVASFAGYSS